MARILLGVTAGIAAYKAADIIRGFKHSGHDVTVVMTQGAKEFITPLTLRTLSGNPVYDDLFFESKHPGNPVTHIGLATTHDIILIAPATADIIGKTANGLAGDLLSTVIMAAACPVIFAPAMNTRMWKNRIVKDNVKKLRDLGYLFIDPAVGTLACGEYGEGKMRVPEEIVKETLACLKKKTPLRTDTVSLRGRTVLITSGATREYIDDVRFISNPSTGKTGCALAEAALMLGAKVIFITGEAGMMPEADKRCRIIRTVSASDMYDAVLKNISKADIMIGSAAVGDFTAKRAAGKTPRKEKLTLKLVPTRDIIAAAAAANKKCFVAGYSAESGMNAKRAAEKMKRKKLGMMVVNDITKKNSGFASDNNSIQILDAKGKKIFSAGASKKQLALTVLMAAARGMK